MNAQSLLNLRKSGKSINGLVIASLLPELSRYTQTVDVSLGDDLRGFYGLDVCVACSTSQFSASFMIIDSLLRVNPSRIIHWGVDSGRLASVYEYGHKLIIPTIANNEFARLIRRLKCK